VAAIVEGIQAMANICVAVVHFYKAVLKSQFCYMPLNLTSSFVPFITHLQPTLQPPSTDDGTTAAAFSSFLNLTSGKCVQS
jgi:hypothetical protein